MDEWNYMIDWDRKDACDFMSTQKGAAFVAANMAAMQDSFVDEACYYSAQVWRVGHFDLSRRRYYKEGEYAATRWNGIYKVNDDLGNQIKTTVEGDARVYCIGATNGVDAGAYFVNFSDEEVEVTFRGETEKVAPYAIVNKKWTIE